MIKHRDRNMDFIMDQVHNTGYVVKPDTGYRGQLTHIHIDSLFEQRKEKRPVEVDLPKFNISYTVDLKKPLQKLGMEDMFDERIADFSGITERHRLAVDQVQHEAVVKVDEEGTEAAAATAVSAAVWTSGALYSEPVRFIVNRPFIFFIRDKPTGMLLFVGKVVDPTD